MPSVMNEKIAQVERYQAKLLDDKDKLVNNLSKDLKSAKDRNISILRESKHLHSS